MTVSKPLPLHVQISEALIREIASGFRADGSRLPPERALAAEFGVAVGTLRKALAILENKDIIKRRQGSGNYISRRRHVQSVYSQFRLERPEMGGLPTAEIISIKSVTPPVEGLRHGLPMDSLCIERLRSLDGLPVAHELIWIAKPSNGTDLTDISESLYNWYLSAFGLVISRVEDMVGMDVLPGETPLDWLVPGSLVGHVQRRAWGQSGQAAEYSRTWFDPERAQFVCRSENHYS